MDSKNDKIDYWGWIKGIFLCILSVQLVSFLCQRYPSFYEHFYLNGLFQLLRVVYDYTLGWSPVPSVYFLFAVLLYLIYRCFSLLKRKKWSKATGYILKFVLAIFFLFYFLWGFNYSGQSLSARLDLADVAIDKENLAEEILSVGSKANGFRPVNYSYPSQTENIIRDAQTILLDGWGIPTYGRVRIRKLQPKGVLLRFSTAGVYIPFVMEGHIDGGLHPIQWPATMAHEMAHGYGITDEGTCNFIAYVTCLKTEVVEIQYSGTILYLRYLLSNYRRYYNDEYNDLLTQVPSDVIQDIRAIGKEHAKYPNLMPETRDKVYDYYLKSHGVKDGLKSYSKIIELVAAWKASDHNPEIKESLKD